MIAADQPTIFGDSLVTGISSVSDGMMKVSIYNTDEVNARITKNIVAFLGDLQLSIDNTNYFVVTYERTDFTMYATVQKPISPLTKLEYDGIATNTPGAVLFLPLADCTGAIFYDPLNQAIMIAHLGRHSTEQKGAIAIVNYMTQQFHSDPSEIKVWLGPSPNGTIYPVWKRNNMSLIEANRSDLLEAGIQPANMEISTVDTATDTNYYSHSEFLRGHRTEDGRFAIAAAIPEMPQVDGAAKLL